MCPCHVPGCRSDTVSERSTTLAPESDAKSKPPPLPVVPEATYEHRPAYAGCSRPTATTCPRTLCPSRTRRNARLGTSGWAGLQRSYLGGFETRPYDRLISVKTLRDTLPG